MGWVWVLRPRVSSVRRTTTGVYQEEVVQVRSRKARGSEYAL